MTTSTFAAAPVAVREILDGPVRPATVLGRFPTACYLRAGDDVVALLTSDAVRLPNGAVLAATSAEYSLERVDGPVVVGGGALRAGPLTVRPGRILRSGVPRLLAPSSSQVRRADALVRLTEHRPGAAWGLAGADAVDAAFELIGLGSGLTPSGDDVVAGFLVAAHAYSLPVDELRTAVLARSRGRTTELSAALLRHAAAGESVPELTALLRALSTNGDVAAAARAMARIGHTSGAALVTGALAAARVAARVDARVAAPEACAA